MPERDIDTHEVYGEAALKMIVKAFAIENGADYWELWRDPRKPPYILTVRVMRTIDA